MVHIDLNTISKEKFVNQLILSSDLSDFYIPREQKLLSLDFDFDQMKQEFEMWLALNSDTQ